MGINDVNTKASEVSFTSEMKDIKWRNDMLLNGVHGWE
jgi:hypothetical protein